MSTVTETKSAIEIKKAWQQVQEKSPNIRIREAAKAVDASEAQLLATMVGEEAIKLKPEWDAILERLPELGRVMSLTRNDTCILEHKGAFEKVNVFKRKGHHMATVLGPIETRVFLKSWHAGFAVKQQKGDRLLTSLQFFDHEGQAITKIYLEKDSNVEAYENLVKDFTAEEQSQELEVSTYEPEEYALQLNSEALLQDWANLKDTHDFFPMLKNHKAHRHDAVSLANGRFTYQVDPNCVQQILEEASKQKLPIMIFAGNKGNLQIHQSTVRTIRLLERGHDKKERWINVLDPNFNLHLKMDLLHDAWVVKKPTKDGVVTSVEFYDANKDLVVQFFGLRKPGIPQNEDWMELVAKLPALEGGLVEN